MATPPSGSTRGRQDQDAGKQFEREVSRKYLQRRGDLSSLYPEILLSFSLSPEDEKKRRPAGHVSPRCQAYDDLRETEFLGETAPHAARLVLLIELRRRREPSAPIARITCLCLPSRYMLTILIRSIAHPTSASERHSERSSFFSALITGRFH